MPRFLSLHVESFARFTTPFTLDLNRRGLVLVEGENRDSGDAFDSNGAGKSMIFEALTWSLTGKMARYGDERLGVDEVCYGEHGADVEVEFENSRGRFLVRRVRSRHGSPSVFIHVREGNEWKPLENRAVHAALVTEDLSTLLGFDYRTLRNAIFLQGTGLDVASSAYAKQMKLLESILRFDDYTRGAKEAAERAKYWEGNARDAAAQMEHWTRQQQSAKSTTAELNTLDESERTKELVEAIRNCEQSIKAIPTNISAAAQEDTKTLYAARDALSSAQTQLSLATKHRSVVEDLNHQCPVCGTELGEVDRTDLVEKANEAIKAWQLQIEEQSTAVKVCHQHAQKTADLVKLREVTSQTLLSHQRELKGIQDRASHRENMINAQTKLLQEAETSIAQLTEQVASSRDTLWMAQTWSKRGFDDLKARTLGAAGPILNAAADAYSNILSGGSLRVEFNTLRDSRSENLLRIRRDNAVCSYESLSNGERRRVDLIIALALRSCARWRIGVHEPLNLTIWDEVFDKLDASGMRRAVEVLQRDLTELETIFVITHSLQLRELFSGAQTITAIRENGESRIAQAQEKAQAQQTIPRDRSHR
jgi:DNA repair exonuclease SbcCD ATPase subunit